uniref:Uncharacterized protein n=1 Tax=Vombatus ursinus TaxID=29139 RepID=A0A4X2KA59_VOMUR
MKQFLHLGSVNACEKTSFLFLHQELMSSVQLVQSWYIQSLQELLDLRDKSAKDIKAVYEQKLKDIKQINEKMQKKVV